MSESPSQNGAYLPFKAVWGSSQNTVGHLPIAVWRSLPELYGDPSQEYVGLPLKMVTLPRSV